MFGHFEIWEERVSMNTIPALISVWDILTSSDLGIS